VLVLLLLLLTTTTTTTITTTTTTTFGFYLTSIFSGDYSRLVQFSESLLMKNLWGCEMSVQSSNRRCQRIGFSRGNFTTLLQVPYGKKGAVPLSTYATMRRWASVARGRKQVRASNAAGDSSSLRPGGTARSRRADERAPIGHGIHVDGVTVSRMTSKHTQRYSE